MSRLRIALIAAAFVVAGLVLWQPARATLLTQQAQIGVTVIVNVTPSPVAYAPNSGRGVAATGVSAKKIVAKMSVVREALISKHEFEAQSLQFDESGPLVVAQVQKPLLVQAEVSPNPNATLLYSNYPTVTVSAVAGTTVQVPCAFTVTVDSKTAWELEEGLSSDFSSDFPGDDLGNNTYVSTPKPTSTPYSVYADNGGKWTELGSGSGATTYCVTLTVTVPSTAAAGTYSSNVIYTLMTT